MSLDLLRRGRSGLAAVLCGSILGGGFALGCASGGTSSAASISAADYAVRKTTEDDLDDRSEVILRQAADKLARARKLRDDGKHEEAERLADEAAIEAQLADATAANARVHEVAKELEALVEALRQEAQGGSSR